jgi:hypothetical protein
MRHRTLRGGAVLAAALLLTSASIAFADTIPADGDAIAPGNQTTIALGERAPGEVVLWNVALRLVCAGFTHAPAGSVISVLLAGKSVPLDGSVTATDTTIGPVPDDWPTAGLPCAGQVVASDEPTVVTLTMPTTPGHGYMFSLVWARSGSGLSGGTVMDFTADVVVNTPPSLSLPDPITIEGNATNGATVSYSVGATDTEDNPDPTPVCSPASGSLFGLGTTSVGYGLLRRDGRRYHGAIPERRPRRCHRDNRQSRRHGGRLYGAGANRHRRSESIRRVPARFRQCLPGRVLDRYLHGDRRQSQPLVGHVPGHGDVRVAGHLVGHLG